MSEDVRSLRCVACPAESPADSRFCRSCGHPLDPPAVSTAVRAGVALAGRHVHRLIDTGKRAFPASTLPDLRAQKERAIPTAPSELRAGSDPWSSA